jgi:type VI secretion system Hcp family effector
MTTDATQPDELDELKARLTTPVTSRRNLLKGAGVAAGGLAALGALGAAAVQNAAPAGATPGPDVPYPGAPSAALYLKANGTPIQGGNTRQGQEGSIEVVYYEQKSTQALNARTGIASGRRQHNPIVIRKPLDKSSPSLRKALVQSQKIDATIKFFRANADGALENYYNVSIKAGAIGSIDEYSPDNNSLAGSEGGGHPLEEVSFSFQSITWQFGETSFTDSISAKF